MSLDEVGWLCNSSDINHVTSLIDKPMDSFQARKLPDRPCAALIFKQFREITKEKKKKRRAIRPSTYPSIIKPSHCTIDMASTMQTPASTTEPSNITTTTQDILQSQIEHARRRIPIRTYHCNFCNHLLIASTHDIASLPRRKAPALDNAIILPLPKQSEGEDGDEEQEQEQELELEQEREEEVDDSVTPRDKEADNNSSKKNDKDNNATSQPDVEDKKNKSDTTATSKSKHYTILLSTTAADRKPIIIRRSDGFEKRLLVRCGRCKVVLGYVLDEVHFGKVSGEGQDGGNSAPEVIYVLPGAVKKTGELEKEVRVENEEWSGWEGLGKAS